jgi:hypothetical protein
MKLFDAGISEIRLVLGLMIGFCIGQPARGRRRMGTVGDNRYSGLNLFP